MGTSIMESKYLMGASIAGGLMYSVQMFTNYSATSEDNTADSEYFTLATKDHYRGWFGLAILQNAIMQGLYFQTEDKNTKKAIVGTTAGLWGLAFAKFLYGAFIAKDHKKSKATFAIQGGMTAALAAKAADLI